jgi:hypothetical protein
MCDVFFCGGGKKNLIFFSRQKSRRCLLGGAGGCFTSHRGGGCFTSRGLWVTRPGQQSRQRALALKCMSTVTKIGAFGKMYGYSPEKKVLMGKCTSTIQKMLPHILKKGCDP